MGYVVPVKKERPPPGFKGATVLSAVNGVHFYPVSALDFASLYPSSMISHNICISSKLTKEDIISLKLKPTDYRTVHWEENYERDDFIKYILWREKYIKNALSNPILKDILKTEEYMRNVVYNNNPIKDRLHNIFIKYLNEKDEDFFNSFDLDINNFYLKTVRGKPIVVIKKEHHYIQPKGETDYAKKEDRGVLPQILQKLLDKRNETKKRMKKETDNFKKNILNGLQLAYKVTCNSVYGQLGATTGNFSNMGVAASVTTTGRQLLEFAQDIVLKNYHNSVAIYGDTDSCFYKFELKKHSCDCQFHKDNMHTRIKKFHEIKEKIAQEMRLNEENFLHSRVATAMLIKSDFKLYEKCDCPLFENMMSEQALQKSIELATEADAIITSMLPHRKRTEPYGKVGVQQFEYEKTYQPYILFSKKRYVGKLYEFDTNQETGWYLDYKGIILKRRDNCGILKKVYKGCLEHIMNANTEMAFRYLDTTLMNIINNHRSKQFPIEDFIISKTLKSLDKYKPDKNTGKVHVAHVMLAQRVAERTPGLAFSTNERVPYCYVEKEGKNLLQGDMIETPYHIQENDIKLDYLYYINKQLMNPIVQLFEYIDLNRVKNIFKRRMKMAKDKKTGQTSLGDNKLFKMVEKTQTHLPKVEETLKEIVFELSDDEEEKPKKKAKKTKKLKKIKKKKEEKEIMFDIDEEEKVEEKPKKKVKKVKKKKEEKEIMFDIDEEEKVEEKPKKKVKKVKKKKEEKVTLDIKEDKEEEKVEEKPKKKVKKVKKKKKVYEEVDEDEVCELGGFMMDI
jgi:DNA polymerase elongation subunit (family B)